MEEEAARAKYPDGSEKPREKRRRERQCAFSGSADPGPLFPGSPNKNPGTRAGAEAARSGRA